MAASSLHVQVNNCWEILVCNSVGARAHAFKNFAVAFEHVFLLLRYDDSGRVPYLLFTVLIRSSFEAAFVIAPGSFNWNSAFVKTSCKFMRGTASLTGNRYLSGHDVLQIYLPPTKGNEFLLNILNNVLFAKKVDSRPFCFLKNSSRQCSVFPRQVNPTKQDFLFLQLAKNMQIRLASDICGKQWALKTKDTWGYLSWPHSVAGGYFASPGIPLCSKCSARTQGTCFSWIGLFRAKPFHVLQIGIRFVIFFQRHHPHDKSRESSFVTFKCRFVYSSFPNYSIQLLHISTSAMSFLPDSFSICSWNYVSFGAL